MPSPAGLVVKNGIEDLFLHLRRDAGAVVPNPDFDTVPQVLGRGRKRWLVIATICLGSALGRRIKAIGNQIEQDPCDVLWEHVGFAGRGIKRPLQRDIEALLFGPRPVIGEIEAFLNESVDIDGPVFARAFARVQQHVLDDGIGALAVLHDLVEIAAQCVRQFVNFSARFIV